MKETYIITAEVNGNEDFRGEIEDLADTNYNILKTFMDQYPNVEIYTLSEFTQCFNDEDFDGSDYWLSYITVGGC